MSLLEAAAEGDSEEMEDERGLALIELDDTAIELDDTAMDKTLMKVQKAVEEKTGKHYTFRTEEMLIQHVKTILETRFL